MYMQVIAEAYKLSVTIKVANGLLVIHTFCSIGFD